jgi:ribonuclease HI
MAYKIYTDGSSNQGSKKESIRKGGWAYLISDEKLNILYEYSESEANFPTNNQCEMLGVINGIKKFKELNLNGDVEVSSDSAYVVNAFSDGWIDNWTKNGWKNALGEPVANKEMWIELSSLVKENHVCIKKIKRRSDILSERVDDLAKIKMRI